MVSCAKSGPDVNCCSPLPPSRPFGISVLRLTGKGEADPVSTTPNLAVFSGPATQISLALASTLSQAGPQEAADWPLDTLPLKLMSVTIGRLALFLIEILLCLVAPSLTRSRPGPDICSLFLQHSLSLSLRLGQSLEGGVSVCFHVCIHACECVACCRVLRDPKPRGSSLCRWVLGSITCLFMYEVRGWTQGGLIVSL